MLDNNSNSQSKPKIVKLSEYFDLPTDKSSMNTPTTLNSNSKPQPTFTSSTTAVSTKNNIKEESPPSQKNKLNIKLILSSIVLLLIILGSSAGFYLSQQTQDLRQQADEIACSNYNHNQSACESAGCTFTPSYLHCGNFNINTCPTIPGCSLSNLTCEGTAVPCAGRPEEQCNNANGCYWGRIGNNPPACAGIAQPCSQQNPQDCSNQLGCSLDGDCVGTPTIGMCTGTPTQSPPPPPSSSCAYPNCDANCSNSSCTVSCQPGTNCQTGRNTEVCHGDSRSGCNQAIAGYDASLSNNSGQLPDTSNSAYWCTTVQLDAWANDGEGGPDESAAKVIWIGDNGQTCVEDTGCSPNNLDWVCEVAPPTADVSNACTPGQAWSSDGSTLAYDINVFNIEGTGVFESSTIFLSFSGTKSDANQRIINFLGNPTWGNCSGSSWCGYYVYRQTELGSRNAFTYTWRTGSDGGPRIGSNQRSLRDLSTFARDTLDRTYPGLPMDVNLRIGGVQTDSLGAFRINIFPDACVQPPSPTPTATPRITPTPTPTATPTPTPTGTPTPSPTPIVGPMCRDIAIVDSEGTELDPRAIPSSFYIGQVIRLRCAPDNVENPLIQRYQFRITEPNGSVVEGTRLNPSNRVQLSLPYTIGQSGEFKAQCRICLTDNTCQPYREIGGTNPIGTNSDETGSSETDVMTR